MAGKPGNPNIREVSGPTRFKKGQSGNPGGRPKDLSLTALVRAELGKPCVEGSPITKREMLAARIVNMAIGGNENMIRQVWAYEDGKPTESIDVRGQIDHTVALEAARTVLRVVGGNG